MIPQKVKKLLIPGKTIYLATSSKRGIPNLIAVECEGISGDKILVADCHFNKTRKNLKENKKTSLLVWGNGDFFQIKGKTSYETRGSIFDKLSEEINDSEYHVYGAVMVSCDEIYDLDKYKRLK